MVYYSILTLLFIIWNVSGHIVRNAGSYGGLLFILRFYFCLQQSLMMPPGCGGYNRKFVILFRMEPPCCGGVTVVNFKFLFPGMWEVIETR